ncbi:Lumazine binding domain-containing protein [Obelidium mucronatum]|nr:Lumazine binding domain-containing protein [Obelidium mucronatum]
MVFTGIVECMGTISSIVESDNTWGGGNGLSVTIADAATVLPDVNLGDSIMVSGVCVTVTEFDIAAGTFKVGIAPETVRRTNLGQWKVGGKVNLERAMLAGKTRLGGHVVQGHVDCPVTLVSRRPDPPNSIVLRFHIAPLKDLISSNVLSATDSDPLQFVTSKGYVCLNGTSLTVTNVDRDARCFEVMLIAYTQQHVNLPLAAVNDQINLEVDELSKYVESVVRAFVDNESVAAASGENGSESALGGLIKRLVDEAVDKKLKAAGIVPK